QIIDNLEQSIGDEKNLLDVMNTMELSANEQQGILLLNEALQSPEDYNIPAIYRYANAPKAEAGFRNGREQFAATHKMSKELVALAEERLNILRAAFEGTGYSADQVIGAQYPIIRQFIDAGFFPGKQTGEVNSIYRIIQDSLGEGSEV